MRSSLLSNERKSKNRPGKAKTVLNSLPDRCLRWEAVTFVEIGWVPKYEIGQVTSQYYIKAFEYLLHRMSLLALSFWDFSVCNFRWHNATLSDTSKRGWPLVRSLSSMLEALKRRPHGAHWGLFWDPGGSPPKRNSCYHLVVRGAMQVFSEKRQTPGRQWELVFSSPSTG